MTNFISRTRLSEWRRTRFASLALAVVLSGCAAPDGGERPVLSTPAQLESRKSLSIGPIADAWPHDRWWQRYGDAQLNALVDEAVANSPTVAEAAARVRTAEGLVRRAGAAGSPQFGLAGEGGLKKQSYNNGIPAQFVPKGWKSYGSLALNGDFDLDLWGRNRAALAAATSDALAAQVDARQAALALQSNVVETYATLGVLYLEDDFLVQAVEVREASAALYAKRYAGGLDSQLPQRQAEAAAAGAAAALEANEERIALQRNVLAALLGAGPDRGLAIERPKAVGPFARIPLPADAGIALAGRRADIVAARLRVEAQGSRIDEARAAFMPDISLRGLLGFMSLGIANLFDRGSDFGQTTGAISLPIFDGGALRGNLEQTGGRYDELVAQYDATVVEALKEVADALASRSSVDEQTREAERAASAAADAYRLADIRYRGGLTTYLDVLSAQTAMIDAQRTALQTRSRLLLTDIQLVRALGGGYADARGDAPVPRGKRP
ncbi:efflux transporter outer membrane subunit [Tsuneonella amylolytica]|uniref:efflux transporter outer membrane subunit n=1 Tax=Tsuneonella amylolytica TaxID=2338327 RepID=UPI000EA907F9|nr:efflux transporter outer membrane subunit [Tsuneonella amylolytica]